MAKAQREYTEAEREAMEMVDDVYDFAADHDWALVKSGVNKQYAWARLARGEGEAEVLQLFYGIDDVPDKFIHGSAVVGFEQIKGLIEAAAPATVKAEDSDQDSADDTTTSQPDAAVVPPTDAAHQGTAMPPTDAAHQGTAMPPTDPGEIAYDAAHGIHHYEEEDAAHQQEVASEVQGHLRDAKKGDKEAWSQNGILEAVKTQLDPSVRRNWSPVASEYTTEELLKLVQGKGIVWRNSFSGRKEEAVVATAKSAGNYPAHITPTKFDITEAGEDMRIIHFLQNGGGFRSVAVARIVSLG